MQSQRSTGNPEATEANPANDITVLHLDDWLLVVDKPAGLLSVPGRLPEHKDCLTTRLQVSYPDALNVHRLDQVTSGLMVFARDGATHRALSDAFARREVDKTYVALVEGIVAQDEGRIELPLICDWPNRPRQVVDHLNGKAAITDWRVIERDVAAGCTRVALHPRTGRSHQLRVHMAELGHPIVGDTFYGAGAAPRVCLHATRLGLVHPASGAYVEWQSPPAF